MPFQSEIFFEVTHKATELLVDREITAFLRVSHGKIQSISAECLGFFGKAFSGHCRDQRIPFSIGVDLG